MRSHSRPPRDRSSPELPRARPPRDRPSPELARARPHPRGCPTRRPAPAPPASPTCPRPNPPFGKGEHPSSECLGFVWAQDDAPPRGLRRFPRYSRVPHLDRWMASDDSSSQLRDETPPDATSHSLPPLRRPLPSLCGRRSAERGRAGRRVRRAAPVGRRRAPW